MAGTGDPNANWVPTGPTSVAFTLEPAPELGTVAGQTVEVAFGNACTGAADFDTKGYWHNRNGLSELTRADIDHANGLAPYSQPSSYFDDGDEPFDGLFSNGEPVSASLGNSGELIAPPGSPKAEVSQFLVDANAGGDPREQLAQQLLAFLFNTLHRLDDPAAAIELPGGGMISAAQLVSDAIAIWESGTAAEQVEMKTLLDGFNNNDAVPFIHFNPCAVVYP